jgi:transcription elongation regulator 1
MKEVSKWNQIKDKIKEDPRYKALKSSKLRERLFEEFIMEEVLVTPGQKRQRMIEQGVEEGNEVLLKLDKSERKRLKKENEEILG